MSACQRKSRQSVIESSGPPRGSRPMTHETVCGETGAGMVRILRIRVVLLMTSDAGCGKPAKPAARFPLVAGGTFGRSMRSQKRKPRFVMPAPHVRHAPRSRRVTTAAIVPELSGMDIRMAGRTTRRRRGKLQAGMTRGTGDRSMLSRQSKFRRCMVERRVLSHAPRIGRVT
jgi:hypothetical protein